jgi:CRP/FNR family cyclic AMP-dependent transcriptional regulator
MEIRRLQSLPLFQGVGDDELAKVAERFQETEMIAGSSLTKEGDFSYKFFVVLEGEVEVYRDFDFVATLGSGEFFGEMGVMKDERRNARVTAKTRVDIAWMLPWDFQATMDEQPVIADRINAVIAERTAE